jgi:hypothetical protein
MGDSVPRYNANTMLAAVARFATRLFVIVRVVDLSIYYLNVVVCQSKT